VSHKSQSSMEQTENLLILMDRHTYIWDLTSTNCHLSVIRLLVQLLVKKIWIYKNSIGFTSGETELNTLATISANSMYL